jgi:hypothetical protein
VNSFRSVLPYISVTTASSNPMHREFFMRC